MNKEKKKIKVSKGMKIKSRSTSDRILDLFIYLFFSLFGFVCVYPFYYIFINTISNNKLSEKGSIIWLPKGLHLQNYIDAFKIPGLGQAAFISISRTVLGTALTVFFAAFLGYMFTRETMW